MKFTLSLSLLSLLNIALGIKQTIYYTVPILNHVIFEAFITNALQFSQILVQPNLKWE
jgi:hypothetical protein